MENSNSIFGELFEYHSEKELNEFIDSIDKKTAIKLIELSILNNQQQGLYSLMESYCLYKCINKLKENEDKTSDIPDDDNHRDIS